MNPQLHEPAIAHHVSEARRPRAWRCARLAIGWLAVCLFATAAFALDPQKSITQLVHTAWTEKDGAPDDIVAITQTEDGYLWLGTLNGLFSFDGVRFARFQPRAGEDLPARPILRLLATRDGSLWIVFSSGTMMFSGGSVSRLLHGHVTTYSEREGLPATSALVECEDGSLIAGTARGLTRFKDGVWKDVTREWDFPGKQTRKAYADKAAVWTVFLDRAGTLWADTEARVIYLPSRQKRFIDPVDRLDVTGIPSNFAEAPDGAIWISESRRSAHTLRRSGDHSPMTEVRGGASWVLFDRDGGLWVGSPDDGLRRIAHPDRIRGHQIAQSGPEAEQFTAKDGLSGNYVYALFEDREGNIWSGTSHGLDRFRESPFTSISILHPGMPRGILGASDGSLWTFAWNEQIVRISPRGDHEVMSRYGATSMFEDESGVLWLADQEPINVSRFQQGRFVSVIGSEPPIPGIPKRFFHAISSEHPLPEGVVLRHTYGIARDREGGIWLFDPDQGVFRLANGGLTKIANQSNPVYPWEYLYADRNGRIWVGQYSRVALYDHGKSHSWGTSDGIPQGPVYVIYHDRAGNVWAGGWGGLSKFEGGRFLPLSRSNGLPAQSVFGMVEDDDGYWWIVTDVGVLRIPAGELDRAVANPTYRIRYESFNMFGDLPGNPRYSFVMPLIARTKDGRIWFDTANGIAYVNPRRILKNNLPPPVHVETLKVDGKVLAPADRAVLSHNMKGIEIDYTALSLTVPERVLFRYKLEGVDTEWQEPGMRRQAFYNSLGPGRYKFHVIASNNDGVWNEAGAALDFSVMPAWYQTMWFRVSCVGGFVLLLWALYQLRLQQLQRQFHMTLEARVGERTRIARDLHDTLLQSFNALLLRLQAVSNVLPAQPEVARERVDSAIEQASDAISEGRDAVLELRSGGLPTIDLAQSINGFVKELLRSSTNENTPEVQTQVEGTPTDLNPVVRDEAYRIAAEALRNAILHSGSTRIEVEIRYDEQQLRLRIRDEGKGIEPSVLNRGYLPGHWGLGGMRERAKFVGGNLKVWSQLDSGTEVELTIPASNAYAKKTVSRWSIFSRTQLR